VILVDDDLYALHLRWEQHARRLPCGN